MIEVRIAPEALETIAGECRASADGRETGGLLLGKDPDDHGVLSVLRAGDPGPKAQRRPDFFLRDLAHARNLAAHAWDEQEAEWVGDWHTHPLGGPEPSGKDLATYARILAHPELNFDHFVAVIVTPGASGDWERPDLTVWCLRLEGESLIAAQQTVS